MWAEQLTYKYEIAYFYFSTINIRILELSFQPVYLPVYSQLIIAIFLYLDEHL